MRRVVVTGVGAVTPLGGDVDTTWSRIVEGRSGIRHIDRFDVADSPVKIAGLVPIGQEAGEFDPDVYTTAAERKKIDRFILYGIGAAEQAIANAGWSPATEEQCARTGVMIGCGIGGLPKIYEQSIALYNGGYRKVSPFFIPASLINEVSGHVSIRHGFIGPNHAVVTACSTGAHAIGDAARLIMLDDADVMIAGGAEAAVCEIGLAGFAAARALSRGYNDRPTEASRPWDQDRDGFVMGEGAGVVVLEELEHAKKRGATIYAEVTGYGLSGDGYHVTAPHPEGRGAKASMSAALARARCGPEKIGYVNAHGTSTPMGDELELNAVKAVFGDAVKHMGISSTKSAIGHLLGAAGGVEAILALKVLETGIAPPTLNLHRPSPGCDDVNLIPHSAQDLKADHVLSNSFGFGGTNASLVLSRYTGV